MVESQRWWKQLFFGHGIKWNDSKITDGIKVVVKLGQGLGALEDATVIERDYRQSDDGMPKKIMQTKYTR